MAEYEQILKVKEDAEARLRTIPGVHAVGIGRKVVAGEPTDELCIVVFLVEKKPLDRLAPEEVVPPEIDGVRTDIVEMEVPRLLMADPPSLKATVSPDHLSVIFTGSNPPRYGLVITLLYTSGPIGAPPEAPGYAFVLTSGKTTLNEIAQNLLGQVKTTAGTTDATLTLTPTNGNTAAIIQCTVSSVDDKRYADAYIRGGIQIAVCQRGGARESYSPEEIGTLGCLATTAQTAEDPYGKVVGITCQHVVGSVERKNRNLTVKVSRTQDLADSQITFKATGAILRGTIVVVEIVLLPEKLEGAAYYRTLDGDTDTKIAKGIADAITNLDLLGLTASAMGPVVTVTGAAVGCTIYGPPTLDLYADLQAKVNGLDIEFTGVVSDSDYGIFTNVNAGGIADMGASRASTFGIYYNPAKGSTPSSIASHIADAIDKMARDTHTLAGITPVTAHASGARVTVSGAQEVECTINSSCRVGQPYAMFPSWVPFINQRIGSVLDARIDVDAALIQLDAGQKYKPEIQDLGLVKGIYDLQDNDTSNTIVKKRGRTSGMTHGTVNTLNLSGVLEDRLYTNATLITNRPGEGPFSLLGDSGSAVLIDGNKVVGILFGGTAQGGLITPISLIIAAFPALKLNLAPTAKAGEAPDAVRIVPEPAKGAIVPPGGSVA